MKKKISIIVGGSGQLGISLIKILLKKKFEVVVTTRNIKKARKKVSIKNKNLKFIFLNVLKKNEILFLLKRFKPNYIYYFAGQSSPLISYKKNKVTYLSNVKGCQNFLEIINLKDKKIIVEIDKKYFRPTEVETLKGNFSKALKELNWKPKTNFKNLVKMMMTADLNRY